MNVFFQDYLIGNHGRDDENEKELYETAVRCFKGASRARSLSHSHYVSNISFFKFFCIYVVCIAVVLIICSFLIVCCFVSFFPILYRDWWYVVVVYFSWRWCIILDSCTLHFGADSAFHKAVKDEFVSISNTGINTIVCMQCEKFVQIMKNIYLYYDLFPLPAIQLENLTTVWSEVVQIDYGFHGYRVFFADVPQQSEKQVK